MELRNLLLTSILAVVLAAACSRKSTSQSSGPQSFDLGAVELTYDAPARQDLGGGQVCVFTARTMNQDSIQLFADLEKGGKTIASTRAAPVRIGVPLDISFGDVSVHVTPQIKP